MLNMNNRRRNTSFQGLKTSQEAMHLRYKYTIAALNELMKDVALVKHRKTLDEVAKAVTRAIENDEKWSSKCQELQTELAVNDSKLKAAMQLSEEDKCVIETLKNDLQTARNMIEALKLKNCRLSEQESRNNHSEQVQELKSNEAITNTAKTGDTNPDKFQLLEEIERGKLQIFELEEELANKEKMIEELINEVNSKWHLLKDAKQENEKLQEALNEKISLNNDKLLALENMSSQTTNRASEMKFRQIINSLKKKLKDSNKRDQSSLEKVKYLIKTNKTLNRQLQIAKNQNNLMKLELSEQAKMLNLLSCQCCKLEESDKKQNVTICELQRIRNKYVHMIGNLEQEIHDIKKSANS